MSEIVTHQEIMRVHRAECAVRGHRWEMVEALGKEDPTGIHCYHCDRFVDVGTPKPDEDSPRP